MPIRHGDARGKTREPPRPKKLYVFLVSNVNVSPELILAPIEGYVRLEACRMRVDPNRDNTGRYGTTFSVVGVGFGPSAREG